MTLAPRRLSLGALSVAFAILAVESTSDFADLAQVELMMRPIDSSKKMIWHGRGNALSAY
jgi:hypothetical protein